VGRGGSISLIAFCLFSVSGCFLPVETPVGPQPIIEERPTLEERLTVLANILDEEVDEEVNEEVGEEVNGEVAVTEEVAEEATEEVTEKGRAWHTAVWNLAARWGGFLWDRLLKAWGLTKEAGAIAIKLGINYVAVAYEHGIGYANGMIRVSAAALDSVTSSDAYKETLDVLSNPGIFIDAYGRLSRFARNLDWSKIDPIRYVFAGTRGVARSLEAAKGVWETIPKAIRAAGPEATARYLAGKDWSHIYPHSLGGSNDPRNGIFEDRYFNRARGAAIMTPREYGAAQAVLRGNAFQVTLQQTAQGALRGGTISAAVLATVAVLELGLQYQQGEITAEEMYLEFGKTVGAAGLAGAAVSGLVTAMALAFPPIIPVVTVISVPLAIVGFSVLGSRLINAGKGWYEVFIEESPLRPEALRYWLAKRYESVRNVVLGRNAVEYSFLDCWPSPSIEHLVEPYKILAVLKC